MQSYIAMTFRERTLDIRPSKKRFEIGYFPETFYLDNSAIFTKHHYSRNRTRKIRYLTILTRRPFSKIEALSWPFFVQWRVYTWCTLCETIWNRPSHNNRYWNVILNMKVAVNRCVSKIFFLNGVILSTHICILYNCSTYIVVRHEISKNVRICINELLPIKVTSFLTFMISV